MADDFLIAEQVKSMADNLGNTSPHGPAETPLEQLSQVLNQFNLEGGLTTRSATPKVQLPEKFGGDTLIDETSMSMGGRVGIDIPFRDLILGLGLTGFFERYRADLPLGLENLGAPDVVKGHTGRLTGLDAFLRGPGGTRLSGSFQTPTPKEQIFRLDLSGKF